MWTIASTALTQLLLKAKEQGFSILLLLIACGGLIWFVMEERHQRRESDQQLRDEIRDCQNQVLQYYRDDRAKSDRIIEDATGVIEEAKGVISRIEKNL